MQIKQINFQIKACTLKRHLQRFHKSVYEMLIETVNRSQESKGNRIPEVPADVEAKVTSNRSQTPNDNTIPDICADFEVTDSGNRSQATAENMSFDISVDFEAEETNNRSQIQLESKAQNVCVDTEDGLQPVDHDDLQPFSLFLSKKEAKIAKEKTRRRDPVYDLFTLNDDTNFVTCNREYCSVKLAVGFKCFHRFVQY